MTATDPPHRAGPAPGTAGRHAAGASARAGAGATDGSSARAAAGASTLVGAGISHDRHIIDTEDHGLHQGLGRRQIQMIAMGSAIGTGLFLGTGSRLQAAGPSLIFLYLACGTIVYLILRNLAELIVYRPTSGSFVSYTREFYGEKMAFVTGWVYWFNWAMTAVADATAIAIYLKWFGQYTEVLNDIPQWILALAVIFLVLILNLISVKVFGELEFWFSAIKIAALIVFLLVGTGVLLFGHPTGEPVGLNLIGESGGWLPNGILPAVIVIQGVVFAYAGVELIGTTAGETKNPREEIPKAINLVMLRIIFFYFGSVFLLCLVMPYTAYSATESPFVTFFASLGINAAAPIMQLVVITAALSALNAGLYSTGRIMHSLAQAGSAPRFAGRLTKSGVPYGGILLTCIVGVLGVFLNYIVPEQTFEIMLNFASLGTMASWAAIALCHWRFVRMCHQGVHTRPSFHDKLAPFSNILTLAFIGCVLVLMAFDYPIGTWTLIASLAFWPFLAIGWKVNKPRIMDAIAKRQAQRQVHNN